MLIGRYFVIIPVMAIAGSLVAKKVVPPSSGTFPTHGGLFVGLLVGVILIIGGLIYFPAFALGPIVEHLAMPRARCSETDSFGVTAMDTSKLRKRMPVSTLFDPKIVVPAIGQAFVKLNPATLIKNPVIFVLEVVTALTTVLLVRDLVQHHAGSRLHVPDRAVAVVHRAVREFRRSGGGRARQGAGRQSAQDPHRDARQAHPDAGQLRGLRRRSGRRPARPAIWWCARRATLSPATAT